MIVFVKIVPAIANEEAEDGVDIMIVIDKSLSMNHHDPNIETLEATHHILNLSLGTGNRVGFVVFNDTIVAYQGLRVIETLDDIDEMMAELRGLRISRGTDIGLGLQTARRQLILDHYRDGRTAMIFLSDGDHEFEEFILQNPNRNQDDVMADVEDVLTTISYPIFTIQYSFRQYLDRAPKNEWGPRTGGANFNAMTPDEMTHSVEEIYRLIMEMAAAWEPPYEEPQVHEHQLMVPIPHTERERVEEIEITLTGDGTVQEILIPAGYDHITVERVGNDFVITIMNPEREYYTFPYLSENELPVETEYVAVTNVVMEDPPIPWGLIGGISVSVVVLLVVLALLILRIRKKHMISKLYPMLNGSLECYFMEIPTGMNPIPTRSWSASFLAANNKISLDKLLKNVLLVRKMPAAAKISVAINIDCTISIINKAGIVCYKDGKEMVAEDIVLRNGEGLYMVFQKNTIEIELRAKLR